MNEAIKQRPRLESTEDLTAFDNGKEFYNIVERAWKRRYLLYGPPGFGKSNLIAAMANYLCGLQNTTSNACCLEPALCTEGTFLVREGDPVNEMVFILRGHLDSYTAGGGHTGFFNSCHNGHGDFGGEELVTYALDARSSSILPSPTSTIKAITEADRAFATVAQGAGHPDGATQDKDTDNDECKTIKLSYCHALHFSNVEDSVLEMCSRPYAYIRTITIRA